MHVQLHKKYKAIIVYAMVILTCIFLMPDSHVYVAIQDGRGELLSLFVMNS